MITFLSDVFHPLVTPLTTYTHTARDTGSETVSAADEDKLPPGGFSLRHGFPEWYATGPDTTLGKPPLRQVDERGHSLTDSSASHNGPATHDVTNARPPHIVQVLQYLRVAFDTDAVIDSIPLNAAANSSAWHAWRSFRSKSSSGKASAVQQLGEGSDAHSERSPSPRQQPGGARRPAEWNWQGVWEDRVRKSTLASLSQQALYGSNDVVSLHVNRLRLAASLRAPQINFVKMDPETLKQHLPSAAALSNA